MYPKQKHLGNFASKQPLNEDIQLTMSATHSTVVVGNCDEVVDGRPVVAVDDVGGHVEMLRGEVDVGVQFVAPVSRTRVPKLKYR